MAKKQLNVRISDATRDKLAILTAYYGTQAEAIAVAIDHQMHHHTEKENAMNEPWKKFTSYENWKNTKWHPSTPIHKSTLVESGGEIVAHTGHSQRAVIQMNDGIMFEEGLGNDGACYPISKEQFEKLTN